MQNHQRKSVVIEDVKKSEKFSDYGRKAGRAPNFHRKPQKAKYDKCLPAPGLLIFHVDDGLRTASNEAL
jgi:hypothetical protein